MPLEGLSSREVAEALRDADIVVFDVDGVIIKKNLLRRAIISRTLRKPGRALKNIFSVMKVYRKSRTLLKQNRAGEAVELAIREAYRRFGVSPEEITGAFRRLVAKHGKEAIDLIKILRRDGKTVVIATQNVDPGIEADYKICNEPLSATYKSMDDKARELVNLLRKLTLREVKNSYITKNHRVVIFEDTFHPVLHKVGRVIPPPDFKSVLEEYKCVRR